MQSRLRRFAQELVGNRAKAKEVRFLGNHVEDRLFNDCLHVLDVMCIGSSQYRTFCSLVKVPVGSVQEAKKKASGLQLVEHIEHSGN